MLLILAARLIFVILLRCCCRVSLSPFTRFLMVEREGKTHFKSKVGCETVIFPKINAVPSTWQLPLTFVLFLFVSFYMYCWLFPFKQL